MKKNLIFPVFFILFLCTLIKGVSQSFEFKGNSHFGIQPINMIDTSRFALKYFFKDMDADGDLDLFLFGEDESDTVSTNSQLQNTRYFIETQENIGNKWNPEFKAREKKFETFNFASGNSFFIPTIGDINGDGRQDFVISAYADSFFIQSIRFDIQTSENNFETHLGSYYDLPNFSPGSVFIPELIDLDMDGDLDLLLTGGFPPSSDEESAQYAFLYAKNTGTISNPEFLGWFANPYGLMPDTFPIFTVGGDIDLDGDMDILGLEIKGDTTRFCYYENNSSADGRPVFDNYIPYPFDLPYIIDSDDDDDDDDDVDEVILFPSLVDIDGDGDLDLFIPHRIDTVFSLDYYENQLCSGGFRDTNTTICEGDTLDIGGQKFTESGEWNIEVTDSKACVSITHLTLEVIPVKTTFIEETLCYGDTFYINNNAFSESGSYELSLMSSSGCDSIVIANLDFIQIDTAVSKQGFVLTAFDDGSYSYQWFDCNTGEDISGAITNVFEPSYSGDFAVKITNNTGCEVISGCHHVIVTGLVNVPNNSGIILWPNPANNNVKILKKSEVHIQMVELYNSAGKLINKWNYLNNNIINISKYNDGVYYFKFRIDNKYILKRLAIIKQ